MAGFELLAILGILGFGQLYWAYQYYHSVFKAEDRHGIGQGKVPILCYFAMSPSWPDNGTLHPAMNATLCTHLLFIDTGVDSSGNVAVQDERVISTYFHKIPILKKLNPDLKILVTNGGGGTVGFTRILATAENRTRYANSVIPFLKKYGFDGLDLDFEFPGSNDLPKGQIANFSSLVQEIRNTFDKNFGPGGTKYLLSAAVGAGRVSMESYQVPQLAKALDFINLMTYDLYTYAIYDPLTGYNSPLYPNTWQEHVVITGGNVGWSTHEWNKRGMPKSKIMVGIPTFIHAWTLMFPEYHGPNSPAKGPGKLDGGSYPEACSFLKENGTTNVWDDDAAVPYAYNGDQWLSYDNERSVAMKAKWTVENGFAGVMVFSLNADDLYGTCGQGEFPLMVAMRKAVNNA